MNLLEARKILKENGYLVNSLNEGCYSGGSGGCGSGGGDSYYRSTGGGDPYGDPNGDPYGDPYYRSIGGGSGSRRSLSQEELMARRRKIAANKARLAEFEEKQLPKLAKLFKVSNDDVRAFKDGSKITAYVKLGNDNELQFICPDGKPEFFRIYYEGFEFSGKLSELKSKINTVTKIGNLLKSFANL